MSLRKKIHGYKAELATVGFIMATFASSLYWAWLHSGSGSIFHWALHVDAFAVLFAILFFSLKFYDKKEGAAPE